MTARALAIAAALAIANAAEAAPAPDSHSAELARIEKRLEDRIADQQRLKNEAAAREKEISDLRFRMVETANAVQDSERRLTGLAAQIESLTAEEAGLAADLMREQALVGDVLAALQSLERSRPPALFVSPDDANKAAQAAILLADAAPTLEARARALRDNLDRLRAVRSDLDRQRTEYAKAKEQVEARRLVLVELIKKKQAERDIAAKLAAAAQRETAALASRATSLRDVIQRLERLARIVAPRIKPPPRRPEEAVATAIAPPALRPDRFAPSRPFAEARGALRPPVVGRIVAAFGSPLPDGLRLDGLRFAAPDQAIVTAPFESKVVYARAWDPVGKLIVLDVGGGYHLLLMGVSVILVQEGQKLEAGEPVGSMSTSPGEREASLDMQIRRNGEPVNPALWLSRKSVEEMRF